LVAFGGAVFLLCGTMPNEDVMASMSDVRLALDLTKLQQYLQAKVPELHCSDLRVKQFSTGTSNPTYLLWSEADDQKRFVLRRKPQGKLVHGAHQIDREYMVMDALHPHSVPVPKMYSFCNDGDVIGAPFYIMECVAGRVIPDHALSMMPGERSKLWDSINAAVVSLHSVDYKAAGLSGYGKVGNFAERQVKTWSKNFDQADGIVQKALQQPQLTKDMHEFRDYLLANMAILQPEPTCVVHGDIGLHNMLIHPSEPRVATLLDWEISTLGHPHVDLDYVASRLDGGWFNFAMGHARGHLEGSPTYHEFMEMYYKRRGLPMVSDEVVEFGGLVSMFRLGAITHGVLARGLSGTASSGSSRNDEMKFTWTSLLHNALKKIRSKQGQPGPARL